jgi:hypothetical protein
MAELLLGVRALLALLAVNGRLSWTSNATGTWVTIGDPALKLKA